MLKPVTVKITTNLWKILKEMGLPGHYPCLLRNLYASQEAIVRTRHGTTDWFKIGKEFIKAVSCLHAYLTMQSARVLNYFSCVQLFATPWTVTQQAHLSMGFSNENTGVGCHTLLQPGDVPDSGIKPTLL